MKKGKLYLVAFYLVSNNKLVYKVGYTSYHDSKKRFQKYIDDGIIRGFRPIASSWVEKLVLEEGEEWKQHPKEKECFDLIVSKFGGYKAKNGKIRFHNFWVKNDEKIGITEIREYKQEEVDYAKKLIHTLGNRYKNA